MRSGAVIGAVAVCLVAWLLALLTWPRGDASGVGGGDDASAGVGIRLDLASLVGAEVSLGETTVTASRDGDRWAVVSSSGERWIGDDAAIRAAARAVLTSPLRDAPEPGAVDGSITLETRDGGRAVVRLSGSASGGLVPGTLTTSAGTRGVLAPADLFETVRNAASGGWRSPQLLERIAPGPTRVVIESRSSDGERVVEFRKTAGRWGIPSSEARVDGAKVDELVAKLQAVRAAGWLFEVDGDAVATVTIETVRPGGGRWVQTLELVGQADLAGDLVSVRVRRDDGDSVLAVGAAVATDAVSWLPASATAFLSRRSVDAAAVDVVGVSVGDRTARREDGAWRDADGVRLAASEAAAVEKLVRLLTSDRGEVVGRRSTQAADSAVRLAVSTIGGGAPTVLEVTERDGELTVWDGSTARRYGASGVWGFD